MTHPETLAFWNSQLQNSVTVPDFPVWEPRYLELSSAAGRLGTPERIATGDDPMQAVWRLSTGRPSHALVFIHGGYWRKFAAADFGFVAETALAADATFWNVDYRLMPAARMADVVADTVAACDAVDAERVVIAGHSAGGHLAVEAALRMRRPPAAVVAISGLYDLDPLTYAFIQDELSLTAGEVAAFSPQTRAEEMPCPVHLVAGADETVEFRRQSARLFEAIRAAGGEATITFAEGRHHSSVVADLADPATPLSRQVAALLA
jgi:arylformamidase